MKKEAGELVVMANLVGLGCAALSLIVTYCMFDTPLPFFGAFVGSGLTGFGFSICILGWYRGC